MYLTFSECVHDAIPSGDLALQVNSSNPLRSNAIAYLINKPYLTRTDLQSKVARRDYVMSTIRNVIQLNYLFSSDRIQIWTQMSLLDHRF